MEEHYQSVSQEISALRKPLKWYWIAGSFINVSTLVAMCWIGFWHSSDKSYSPLETCLYGMESVFNNNPTEALVDKSVTEDIKKLKITFDIERIYLIKNLDSSHCDVVTKDNIGFRNYRVTPERNSKFKHLYRILDVLETQIESRYQR